MTTREAIVACLQKGPRTERQVFRACGRARRRMPADERCRAMFDALTDRVVKREWRGGVCWYSLEVGK